MTLMGGGGGVEHEGLGEKQMPVLLCLPEIKQDRPGFEPSIRGEGQISDCLRQGRPPANIRISLDS
jgi:hypothetical protein